MLPEIRGGGLENCDPYGLPIKAEFSVRRFTFHRSQCNRASAMRGLSRLATRFRPRAIPTASFSRRDHPETGTIGEEEEDEGGGRGGCGTTKAVKLSAEE